MNFNGKLKIISVIAACSLFISNCSAEKYIRSLYTEEVKEDILYEDNLDSNDTQQNPESKFYDTLDSEEYYMLDYIEKKNIPSKYKIQDFNYERDRNYHQLRMLLLNNRYGRAENILLDFVRKYPADKKYKEFHYYLGMINENKGSYIKAVQNYSEAISIYPRYSRAWNALANLYSFMRQYNRAEECYSMAIKSNPYNPFIHYNAGNFYFGIGDYKNAVKHFKYAIKYKANFGSAFYNLGIIMYKKNLYKNAIEYINRAIDFKKETHIGYYYIGLSHYRLDKREKAIACLKEAIAMENNFFEAYIQLGRIYQRHGEYENAINNYKKAEKTNPGYVDLKIWIAECHAEMHMYDRAIKMIQELLIAEPGNKKLVKMLRTLKDKKYNRNLNRREGYIKY